MISKKMAKAINAQINREFYSAFLYLAMANDAMDKGFKGASNWFTIQFKEEQEHAMKFSAYLQDRGAKVKLAAMDMPIPVPQIRIPLLFSSATTDSAILLAIIA